MGKRSKDKGSRFERIIAKRLSLWWYGDETVLRRTPLSGGWSQRHGTSSDICTPPNVAPFPFAVECKCDESWDLHQLFTLEDGGPIGKWWKKLIEDDHPAQAKALAPLVIRPILVFTRNRMPVFVALRVKDAKPLAAVARRTKMETASLTRAMADKWTAITLLDRFLLTKPSDWVDGEAE